jgi:RNA polymerase sigma-70 factor (ECF subfamily)
MDLKSLSDEEIAVLVRTKNQEIYRELVERYQDKIIRYSAYIVGNKEHARDIAQEAFLKAFMNLWGFNQNLKFSSWLYRIAHNEAINYIKKHKKEFPTDPETMGKMDIESEEDLFRNMEKKESSELIESCLPKIPIKYREPIALYYLDEKSYEEISDVLRIPLSTVGVRIMRGKKILKLILHENGYRK